LLERLASELISPNIQINSSNETIKAASDFAAFRHTGQKLKFYAANTEIPSLDPLLKHRRAHKTTAKPGILLAKQQ
jgi:hypothetical protein